MTRCFLETTAQIRRLATSRGSRQVRDILQSCDNLSCVTSVYVLMELQRTLCEDVLFVRDRVREVDGNVNGLIRLQDIVEYFGVMPNVYSVRRSQRIMLITKSIIDFFAGEQFIPARALAEYLGSLAVEYMERAVRVRIEPGGRTTNVQVDNPAKCTACLIVSGQSEEPPPITCRKQDSCCSVDELIGNHRSDMAAFIELRDRSNCDQKTIALLLNT